MYVPVEYSNVIPGQRKNRLDDRQQAMMIKRAAIPPVVSCLRCLALLAPCQRHLASAPGRSTQPAAAALWISGTMLVRHRRDRQSAG